MKDEYEGLVVWVNGQPLAIPLVCLGDGHEGIWNLFENIATSHQRLEILEWFHRVENLHNVGGSQQGLAIVKALLWKGQLDAAIEQFKDWQHERVDNFLADRPYPSTHPLLPNSAANPLSIPSATVEKRPSPTPHVLLLQGFS